jgi:hypothetical protein
MGSSRPATGCTIVSTDFGLGCSVKGKTIAKKVLAVVFFYQYMSLFATTQGDIQNFKI